jgi:hypothetical protein
VPGNFQLEVARALALDLVRFMDDAHRLPAALIAVLVRIGGVQFVDVEVFLIDVEDRETEGDGAVMADRDARQGGLAGADHREARRIEADDVAQRRHAVLAVRVVGQDRPPCRGARRRHDPVVGADGVGLRRRSARKASGSWAMSARRPGAAKDTGRVARS